MFKHRIEMSVICLSVLAIIIGLIAFPAETANASRESLMMCANILIPSLFPFFVLSNLIIESGIARYLGHLMERLMCPIFRVNGTGVSAVALGLIGGYPIGATTAISLHQKKLCSKTEAERLLGFCNNCGPAFVLGAVGIGIFQNARIGILLYIIHITASLFVGFIFRFYRYHDKPSYHSLNKHGTSLSFYAAFPQAIRSGLASVLNVCAFVVFFAVLLRILTVFGILPFLASLISKPLGISILLCEKILIGALEITTGLTALGKIGLTITTNFIVASFLLGWAGVSVHCQVLSFIGESGLSLKAYFMGKCLHGIISAMLAYCVTRLPIFMDEAVSCAAISSNSSISLGAFTPLFFITIPFILIIPIKKYWKFRRR